MRTLRLASYFTVTILTAGITLSAATFTLHGHTTTRTRTVTRTVTRTIYRPRIIYRTRTRTRTITASGNSDAAPCFMNTSGASGAAFLVLGSPDGANGQPEGNCQVYAFGDLGQTNGLIRVVDSSGLETIYTLGYPNP